MGVSGYKKNFDDFEPISIEYLELYVGLYSLVLTFELNSKISVGRVGSD